TRRPRSILFPYTTLFRSTLDAMPGKQMSIDADLRAGAINQAQARGRRRELERESQLFGSMDGAMKFVKGDAIAGLIIVLINLVRSEEHTSELQSRGHLVC